MDHIHKEFTTQFRNSRVQKARAYALQKQFEPTLRSAIHHYNINADSIGRDKQVQAIQAKIIDMKQVLGRNLEILLQRETKLETLLAQTSTMQQEAQVFQRQSIRLRRQQSQKHILFGGLGILTIALLIYMTVMGVCGVGMHYCRNDGNSHGGNGEGGGGGGGGK